MGENDTVPAGVHVRMDMTTGEKWVKIVDDEDDNDNAENHKNVDVDASSISSSAVVSMAVVNEIGSVNFIQDNKAAKDATKPSSTSYDFDMMFRTLSKLPDDEKVRMGGLPEPPQHRNNVKEVTPEQRQAFEKRMLEIWEQRQEQLKVLYEQMLDFPAIIKERIKSIDEYLKDPHAHLTQVDLDAEWPEGVVTHIVSVLHDLQFQLSDVDMARDFHTMGGWPLLATLVSEDTHVPTNKTVQDLSRTNEAKVRRVQSLAAESIGTAVKNTEEFFSYAVEVITIGNAEQTRTVIDMMIDVFCQDYSDDWESRTLLSKTVYAIGAMLRGNRMAQVHVLKTGGFDRLGDKYRALSSHETFTSANTKLVLRLSSLESDIVEDVLLHPEIADVDTNQRLINAVTSEDWCEASCQSLTSDIFLPVEAQESVLHSVAVIAPYCKWNCDIAKMQQSIVHMKAEWESDRNNLDEEHLHHLFELAARALGALANAKSS